MPYTDPIPALKRQVAAQLVRELEGWNADDIGDILGTDRRRIGNIRRGRLERFSLETLMRYLARLGCVVELRLSEAPPSEQCNRRVTQERSDKV